MPTMETVAKDPKGKKVATLLRNAGDPNLRPMRRKRKVNTLKRRVDRVVKARRTTRTV